MEMFAMICAGVAIVVTPLYFIFFRKGIKALKDNSR
jgi:hypothetical protein